MTNPLIAAIGIGTAYFGTTVLGPNNYITVGSAVLVGLFVFRAGSELRGIKDQLAHHDKSLQELITTRKFDMDSLRSEMRGWIEHQQSRVLNVPPYIDRDRKRFKLLLVDDDDAFRQLFVHHLHTQFDIIGVGTLVEAVEAYRDKEFDLVVLDLRIPGEAETDIVRKFIDHHPGALCVVISGYQLPEASRAALQQGADAFIAKDDIQFPNFLAHTLKNSIVRRSMRKT